MKKQKSQKVECNDKSCKHNEKGICVAEVVKIYTGIILEDYSHAECTTYKSKVKK